MKEKGWVKLYRNSINSTIWQNPNYWRVWTWCLMKANHRKKLMPFNGADIEIEPGQFVTGLHSARKELLTSPQSIRTAWGYLKSTNRITIKSTNKFSLITVVNWTKYQKTNKQDNNQANKPVTNEQQTSNNKQEEAAKAAKEAIEDKSSLSFGNDEKENLPITNRIAELWNEAADFSPGSVRNTTVNTVGLLKRCRKATPEIASEIRKKKVTEEEFKIAVQNYITEITCRDPSNDYALHRFSLYDFLKQTNGYKKFLNA